MLRREISGERGENKARRVRICWRVAAWVLAVDLVAVMALLGTAEWTTSDRDRGPPGTPPKYVVVLFGDAQRLGSTTATSLQRALDIASDRTHFLCVGGARPHRGYWGSCEMRAWLLERGVTPARVSAERVSYDTATNLVAAKSMLRNSGGESAVIVTDSLHALRIRLLFKDDLGDALKVWGYPLLDGSNTPLDSIVSRAQYEVLAWMVSVALPATWTSGIAALFRGSVSVGVATGGCSDVLRLDLR